jgi:hypothetical protein
VVRQNWHSISFTQRKQVKVAFSLLLYFFLIFRFFLFFFARLLKLQPPPLLRLCRRSVVFYIFQFISYARNCSVLILRFAVFSTALYSEMLFQMSKVGPAHQWRGIVCQNAYLVQYESYIWRLCKTYERHYSLFSSLFLYLNMCSYGTNYLIRYLTCIDRTWLYSSRDFLAVMIDSWKL